MDKPYRKLTPREPQGIPFGYKDISKTSPINEEQLQTVIENTTITTIGGSGATVPDATTVVKGILQLAGDLAGTAASPTVPGLATKVPTSRLINTTAPLTGGGDLSSDRTLAVSNATTSAVGVVELATDGEAASDKVVQGNDQRLQDIWRQTYILQQASGNVASQIGASATLTNSGTRSDTFDSNNSLLVNCVTGGGINNDAGVDYLSTKLVPIQALADFYWRVKTGSNATDIQNVRIWIYLGNAGSGSPLAFNDVSQHAVGFRFSTSVPDTNWICYSNDNGATGTTTDSGVAVAHDTEYRMRIHRAASSLTYYINETLVATISTDIPGNISAGGMCAVRALAAAAKNIKLGLHRVTWY